MNNRIAAALAEADASCPCRYLEDQCYSCNAFSDCPCSKIGGLCEDPEADKCEWSGHKKARSLVREVLKEAASEADSFDPHEDEKLDVPTSIGAAIRALLPEVKP